MSSPDRFEIDFTPLAIKDLADIFIYGLSTWGEAQAVRYDADIRTPIARLTSFPAIGRQRDDIFVGCRRLVVNHHLVLYRIDQTTITVVRILHASRDVEVGLDTQGQA